MSTFKYIDETSFTSYSSFWMPEEPKGGYDSQVVSFVKEYGLVDDITKSPGLETYPITAVCYRVSSNFS